MKTEKDLDTMDLPKANYYEQLETLSEQNFQILFNPSKFHFCTRDRRDKGLDITYEIIRADNHIGFRFVVQLKSTESIKANKDDGSFSVSLDTSNINYLLNNNCPAFYVLYEVNTKTFYYESITDFLKTLIQKANDWEKQGSHVLRFSKKILPDGITEMYDTAQRIGLLQRNLIESATLISASVNQSDRVSIDSDFTITDDAKIRKMIEVLGFELINEGKWREILFVHNKASGNVATTGLYNLILGIANYYGGSRWLAKSFLKSAKNLKSELDEELQKHLQYFDTTIDYSLGLIDYEEFNNRMQTLLNSETVGLYVKLENAKRDYVESMANKEGENYEKYVKEIEEIINHPKANDGLKLTAKCELILFQGFKNNSDYVSGIARLNAMEEFFGADMPARIESAKQFIETNSAWYKNVEETINEAAKSKNNFAYFTAFTNEVKVSYQFNVYTTTVFIVKDIPGQPKPERPDNKPMIERMLKRIGLAANFFSQIGHIENTIAASSTFYEILHYTNDLEQANRILAELENLVERYDLKDHKERLERLKNGGTTHETFRKWFNGIFETANQKKKEHESMEKELREMDEEEKKIKDKPFQGNHQIHLFPIGYFQFPISAKEKVYEILQVNNPETRKNFDEMFKIVIPVANIFYPEIEKEGFQDGNAANRDITNWKNIYRVRKAFYENKFYRFEPNI
jgi:hypothetical protein